jgi:regulator of RNase E activity RraA
MELEEKRVAALCGVTTATLTTLLLKKGLRNVWMRGTSPIRTGQARVAGRAFTLRFIPAREDQATPESWAKPISTRTAIEAMPADCIAIVDARGVTDAGIFGDILCARMRQRGVAALITDGVVRDIHGVLETGLPVWCSGAAASPAAAWPCFPMTSSSPTTMVRWSFPPRSSKKSSTWRSSRRHSRRGSWKK